VPSHHDERLQSLRGLAALLVIVGHGLIVLPQTPFMFALGGIFEADASVVFFYVLSGFVLGQSLSRDARFFPFVVRRLFRLLPVLWVSLAAAIVVSRIVAGPPLDGATDWYNFYRSVDTSPNAIAANALGLSWRINSVMWSVQIELFVIPLLPLGALALRRFAPWQSLMLLIGLCAVAAQLSNDIDARPVAYLYCFFIGMLIPSAMNMRSLQSLLSPATVLVGLGIAVAFHEVRLYQPARNMVDALVSAQLIACVIRSRTGVSLLRHRWLVLLGDVSYSLYAFGQITLIFIAYAMFKLLPSAAWTDHPTVFSLCLIGLNIAFVLPIAVASYRWVELPGMALAKSLFGRRAAAATT
jgi:peptidoglycan/LPS O-acetylase OafA/YrhL